MHSHSIPIKLSEVSEEFLFNFVFNFKMTRYFSLAKGISKFRGE